MKKLLFQALRFLLLIGGISSSSLQAATAEASQFSLIASYTIDSSWPSGFQVTVTLRNNSATPSSSWTASFSLPQSSQSVSSSWNGVATASGQQITVTNPTWVGGGVIPSGGTTTFGMIVQNPQSGPVTLNNLQAVANGNPLPPPPIPNAPVLNPISINPNSPTSYTVSWNSVPNATTYTLQQATNTSFSNAQTLAQGAILSYSVTNQPNGTYYYRVTATDSAGTSPYSNVQSVTVSTTPISLQPPVLQTIVNSSGAGQYLLTWSSVQNALQYVVQEATQANFSNAQTIFTGSGTSNQVSGKAPGTYYYRVRAINGTNMSAYSNTQSTTVTQPLPAITTIIEGYWESWNSRVPINTIVNMKANVIDISFANFMTTGSHTFAIAGLDCDQATLTQFITAAHSAGKKVKISIGGATYPLSGQLLTVQDAVGMANAVAQFVSQNSLDGVDYDIEDYPAANLQVALLQNTRQLLGNNALISYTAKAPASTTLPYSAVIQSGHSYVNTISIMAYDYGPGYTYQQDTTALLAMGVPASKIVIGLMPGYDDLHVMTSLSNISTAAQYIKTNRLGGIMFWDLNRDHENITGLGVDAATTTAWNILQ